MTEYPRESHGRSGLWSVSSRTEYLDPAACRVHTGHEEPTLSVQIKRAMVHFMLSVNPAVWSAQALSAIQDGLGDLVFSWSCVVSGLL